LASAGVGGCAFDPGSDRIEPGGIRAAIWGRAASAVREWELGRRQPEASARVLLLVIARRPEVVDEALAAGRAAE
jgi:hypothetical protein